MLEIDKIAPVMVTGATGYVAGWIVKRLLEEGLTVHAPVRDPEDRDKLKYLNEAAAGAPGQIGYFAADLPAEGSYAEAMAGCRIVFHTASPFRLGVKDPQRELVDPARLGTRNVLEEVNRTGIVERVVLTSSCAAIYGDNADLDDTPDGVFTEAVWNTSSSLTHQPYSYSKTVAEREAWAIHDRQDRWRLVVINPSLVVGPGLNPRASSESFRLIRQFGDGTLRTGVPRLGCGVVDVRDVAAAHFQAAFLPEAAGRYITSGHNSDFSELAAVLAERYGDDYPIPRRIAPKWLIWLFGPLLNRATTRRMVELNVERPWRADNGGSVRELGVSYRPLASSVTEMFQQMIDSGYLARRG